MDSKTPERTGSVGDGEHAFAAQVRRQRAGVEVEPAPVAARRRAVVAPRRARKAAPAGRGGDDRAGRDRRGRGSRARTTLPPAPGESRTGTCSTSGPMTVSSGEQVPVLGQHATQPRRVTLRRGEQAAEPGPLREVGQRRAPRRSLTVEDACVGLGRHRGDPSSVGGTIEQVAQLGGRVDAQDHQRSDARVPWRRRSGCSPRPWPESTRQLRRPCCHRGVGSEHGLGGEPRQPEEGQGYQDRRAPPSTVSRGSDSPPETIRNSLRKIPKGGRAESASTAATSIGSAPGQRPDPASDLGHVLGARTCARPIPPRRRPCPSRPRGPARGGAPRRQRWVRRSSCRSPRFPCARRSSRPSSRFRSR